MQNGIIIQQQRCGSRGNCMYCMGFVVLPTIHTYAISGAAYPINGIQKTKTAGSVLIISCLAYKSLNQSQSENISNNYYKK